MSNHDGSYLLNDALNLLQENGVLDLLGREKSRELAIKFVGLGDDYDCNQGEILHGIAETLGFCFNCLEPASHFENNFCQKCVDSGDAW